MPLVWVFLGNRDMVFYREGEFLLDDLEWFFRDLAFEYARK